MEYAVVDAIHASIRHAQNSTLFKHPIVASKVWVHEGNEFVDVVHVVDEIHRITISVGDRLGEPYGFDTMDCRCGHPFVTYLANKWGMHWIVLVALGVTSRASAGGSLTTGKK